MNMLFMKEKKTKNTIKIAVLFKLWYNTNDAKFIRSFTLRKY